MTHVAIDWRLVRYSDIEGTHYFYDPSYPATIQFLQNGQWEAWDVGWTRRRTYDPEVRRIAEEAEYRLIHDPASGYQPWPQTPPASDIGVGGDRPSQPSLPSTPLSPTPMSPIAASPHSTGNPFPQLNQPAYITPYTHHSAPAPAPGPSSTGHAQSLPPVQGPVPAPAPPKPTPAVPNSGSQPPHYGYFPPSHYADTPATPLPFPPNTETKIVLSLDGDGVRGLSAALIVESLVNAICSKLHRRVDPHQIFDLIGGVSTTGLLAIMIGRMRMRVHRAREAYCEIAKAIYQDKYRFYASLLYDPQTPMPQPSGPALETTIQDLVMKETGTLNEGFFDTRPHSTNVFVISTKIDIGYNNPAIIRSYPTRRMAGPEVPADIKTWEAILATCVAPRYTNPGDLGPRDRRAVIEPGFVDYGTAKNNPIKDAVYECKKLYSYTNDTMVVVSVGTGSGCDRNTELKELANAVDDRTSEALIAEDKFEVDNRNLIEQGWMKYFRFEVPDMHDVPLDEAGCQELVMQRTSAYLARPDVHARFYACVDAVIGVLVGDQAAWPQLERWEN